MPRTALTPVQATRAGTVLPAAVAGDVANGNSVANDGRVVLVVKNTNASSTARTVTFAFTKTVDGQAVTARAETIPAGETQVFGPFPPTDYGTSLAVNADNAELTVQVIRV
ncbi:hypothetical protein DF268_08515 [Streptomyces sp. V2]|uniref:hypothetical protein n=1 Tax=Streptomyces sp. V2 TaxID=1424099 RepID=UPI000D671458|nr:hypothetical protein [Streptomyces sp. V2]PWG13902.1 hypothetical protein DF268_08515 [Streptomyces sp. V2]